MMAERFGKSLKWFGSRLVVREDTTECRSNLIISDHFSHDDWDDILCDLKGASHVGWEIVHLIFICMCRATDFFDQFVKRIHRLFIELLFQFSSSAPTNAPRVAMEVLPRRVGHADERTL